MKRAFDLLLASVAMVVAGPIILVVALVVWRDLGRPVLFRQRRPGKDGELFEMLKFRTMRDAVDAEGVALPDAERLTRVGRFLRRTSLDELPELWNVLRGEMSLVGPRPLLEEYLALYDDRQARRHECRPGITGWAQIHGRNAQTWRERFELDLWYVDHRSFWLDLRILAKTLWIVVAGRGVSAPGEATMRRFRGESDA